MRPSRACTSRHAVADVNRVDPSDPSRNIGERGARRRARGGVVWAALGVVLAVVLLVTGAPLAARWLIAVPFALAAIGFLQAHERT